MVRWYKMFNFNHVELSMVCRYGIFDMTCVIIDFVCQYRKGIFDIEYLIFVMLIRA